MADLSEKLVRQIEKAGLPQSGVVCFEPLTTTNRNGEVILSKADVLYGPKKGKKGYADTQGRIWIKDRAHSGLPDHWDVQIDGGLEYFRVDLNGDPIH